MVEHDVTEELEGVFDIVRFPSGEDAPVVVLKVANGRVTVVSGEDAAPRYLMAAFGTKIGKILL